MHYIEFSRCPFTGGMAALEFVKFDMMANDLRVSEQRDCSNIPGE